jgi:serine/threonine-protein kinase HipA
LAIGFNGTKDPKIVDTARLRDIAPFIEMDLRMVEREMRRPQHAL